GVVINLAVIRNHDVLRKSAVARNARRMATLAARRWNLLHDVGTVIEVDGAGLDSAVLANRAVLAIGGNERPVVAQAQIHSQLRRRLPGVLEIKSHDATPSSSFVDVATPGTIGHIQ